ncbi:hypothetical protein BDC45DRAFT_536976 [Circinella umbellata]|nr:hypothetical protein BDC45DRAFT_536976 [Circinella umbellata]
MGIKVVSKLGSNFYSFCYDKGAGCKTNEGQNVLLYFLWNICQEMLFQEWMSTVHLSIRKFENILNQGLVLILFPTEITHWTNFTLSDKLLAMAFRIKKKNRTAFSHILRPDKKIARISTLREVVLVISLEDWLWLFALYHYNLKPARKKSHR